MVYLSNFLCHWVERCLYKYRNKMGIDVALEALREAWHGKRMTSDDICRVANVICPFLAGLVWAFFVQESE